MKKMKTCENCGCKVFGLGCVNCDEDNYIEEQKWENERMDRESKAECWCSIKGLPLNCPDCSHADKTEANGKRENV